MSAAVLVECDADVVTEITDELSQSPSCDFSK
jgi:hypothetical protein